MIKINLNLEKIGHLRYSIDSKESLIKLKKVETKSVSQEFSVWTRIRVILCRLEDTTEYVNTLELRNQKYKRAAFDFYDFINNSCVIIDCVKEFAKIFTLETRTIEVATDVFNMIGDGSGNDGKFFKYIRSLTSAHPLKTSFHAAYHGENNEHSCYYVTWNSFLYEKARDLSVFIYSADENNEKETIGLKVSDFEKYLNKWICFIDEIIVAINNYSENKILELVSQRMKTPNEFGMYIEYLQYLKEEMNKRYNYDTEYAIDSLIKVFYVQITNSKNIPKFELYRNAIQYSVSFLHKRLQDMNGDDTTNTGILFPEPNTKTELYLEMARPFCMTSDVDKYRYNLEKLMYLSGERSVYSIMTARSLLDEMKDWLNGYVVFANHESNEETIVLVHLAQYLDCLNHKSCINKNIPNSLKYRERLLLDDEMRELPVMNPERLC